MKLDSGHIVPVLLALVTLAGQYLHDRALIEAESVKAAKQSREADVLYADRETAWAELAAAREQCK